MPVDISTRDGVQTVATPSTDNLNMSEFWTMVNTIIQGVRAMRGQREKYLPKFPHEAKADYDFRLKTSTMTNVYTDVLKSIVAKPFSEECSIKDADKHQLEWLQEDIDGSGNHISIFLRDVFTHGINSALDWILVDYPNVQALRENPNKPMTLAEEKALNVRPYWVRIAAENMLEVCTAKTFGRERISYVRFLEDASTVRIIDARIWNAAPQWYVFTKDAKGEWNLQDAGTLSIDVIPVVPFITGERCGNSWEFIPPLRDAADLQVELFQKETGLKNIETLTCFPMLAANGVTPEYNEDGTIKPIAIGPGVALYAPPNDSGQAGSWSRIASDAESLRFISEQIDKIINRIRELGKQPLTAQSGNVTRINAAFASTKANSAAQNWALALKDCAELALIYTMKWLNSDLEPEIDIFVDFPIETDDDKSPDIILKLREKNDLSQETVWTELKRRRVLSRDFDAVKEKERIANEYPSDEPTVDDLKTAGDFVDPTISNPPENTPALADA